MGLIIERIDHVVVNCRDVDVTAAWYERVLGMVREEFGPDHRIALKFGSQKLNLRPSGAPNWDTGAVDAPARSTSASSRRAARTRSWSTSAPASPLKAAFSPSTCSAAVRYG